MCVLVCPPSPSFLSPSPFQSFFFLVSFASQIHLLPPLSPTKMFCAAGEGGRGGVWQRKDIGRFSPSFLPLLSPRFRTQRETFFASEIYWVAGKLCVRGSTLLKWLVRRVCRHTYSAVRQGEKKYFVLLLSTFSNEKMRIKYVTCYYKMPSSGYAGGPPGRYDGEIAPVCIFQLGEV